ncbi:MAG: ABC transporter substrate-binding protein [Pseudomonadales bacterium]|nr:ABC transporter substrate-binding protein [Pseudomonadales bacterium]
MTALASLVPLFPLLVAVLVILLLVAKNSPRAVGPVLVGLDLERKVHDSPADDAILFGAQQAVMEINGRGGVLGGRRLKLVLRENRGSPRRGVANIRGFARIPELVAYISARPGPVAEEQARLLPRLGLNMLAPWVEPHRPMAKGVDNGRAFCLSVDQTKVVAAALRQIRAQGCTRLGAILNNESSGRGSHDLLRREIPKVRDMHLVGVEWYALEGAPALIGLYHALRRAGAQAVYLAADEKEAARFLREVESLPAQLRLPIVNQPAGLNEGLPTMNPRAADARGARHVWSDRGERAGGGGSRMTPQGRLRRVGVEDTDQVLHQEAINQTYDLVQRLAQAIEAADCTDRQAVRRALEGPPGRNSVSSQSARPLLSASLAGA